MNIRLIQVIIIMTVLMTATTTLSINVYGDKADVTSKSKDSNGGSSSSGDIKKVKSNKPSSSDINKDLSHKTDGGSSSSSSDNGQQPQLQDNNKLSHFPLKGGIDGDFIKHHFHDNNNHDNGHDLNGICSLFHSCHNNHNIHDNDHNHDGSNHNHDNHNHVEVITKTVVVHDNNNQPQTLVLNANAQTCFITLQQLANIHDAVTELLNNGCPSVTILQ